MGGMKRGRVAWGGMGWHGVVHPIYQTKTLKKGVFIMLFHPCHPILKL